MEEQAKKLKKEIQSIMMEVDQVKQRTDDLDDDDDWSFMATLLHMIA